MDILARAKTVTMAIVSNATLRVKRVKLEEFIWYLLEGLVLQGVVESVCNKQRMQCAPVKIVKYVSNQNLDIVLLLYFHYRMPTKWM